MPRRALALVLVLVAGEVAAAPAPAPASTGDRSRYVIPPGREAAARALLEQVVADTPAPYEFRGPAIEYERIKWWLQREGEPIGMLLLRPREHAEQGDALSQSFAIRETWAPDHVPSELEVERMRAAREAVIAGDHGQFYVYRFDVFEADAAAPRPPYLAPTGGDPLAIRRTWSLELAGVGLLVLLALALTFRPRSER